MEASCILPLGHVQLIQNSSRLERISSRILLMNELVSGLSDVQLTTLRKVVGCLVLTGNDPEDSRARRVWNGMIDRQPYSIVRPTSIADVIQAVRFCREHGIAASVRGGGHSVAGKAVANE